MLGECYAWEVKPICQKQCVGFSSGLGVCNVIDTKWIFKNKTNNQGAITKNNARLVAQGYTLVEGVDFDGTFASIARLESICILIVVAYILGFKLYQMDVKSTFLNGILWEEVYIE